MLFIIKSNLYLYKKSPDHYISFTGSERSFFSAGVSFYLYKAKCMANKIPHSKDIKGKSKHHPGGRSLNKEKSTRRIQRKEEKEIDFHLLEKFALTTQDIICILDSRNKKIHTLFSPPEASVSLLSTRPLPSDPFEREINLLDLILPEDARQLWQELETCSIKGVESTGEFEVRIKDQNGTLRFFNLRFTPHKIDEDKKVQEWFCQLRDITEKQIYVQKIKENQLQLQMALEGSGMGSWTYELQSQKLFCDEKCCFLFGLNASEFDGNIEHFFSRIHEDEKDIAKTTADFVLSHQGRFTHDIKIVIPETNAIRYITIIGEQVPSTECEKITGVCFDISQNRQAEKKVKPNEVFLEELQKIAKIGCFDWDLEQDKVHLTNEMYTILGITSKATLYLEGFYQKVHPQDRKEVEETIKYTIRKGGGFSKEFRYSSAEGETKDLWAQGLASMNDQSRTTHLVGTIQDISEKKEKEKEINTQNLIIKSILHNLPVIIQIIDKNGMVKKLLGEAGLRRLGMEENQTVGESVFNQSSEIRKHIKKVLKGATVNFMESLFHNGRQLTFLNYYFYDAERELAIGFSIDISAQKQTEAAFQQVSAKNRELERMNQVMDMFVYATAHDLKNPINNLGLLSTLLQQSTTEKERNEYLEALSKSVYRLKQTIHGLTEIIEIESSKGLQSKKLKFNDVLNHVLADLDPLLKGKNGTLEVNFKKEIIQYNKAFLTSIIKNLLSNAIKYSDANRVPQIKISTEKRNEFVLLTVSDNGIGIDLHQYRPNLFKPFKRFTSQAGGTGVGLHLIKSMVEKNGGFIEVESTPGQGTTFHCYLLPY